MLKNKNSLLIILGVAVVSFGAVSIAFAALSQTLNITSGKVTQNALTWNVGFVAGTYTGTADGTSSNGLSCGSITATRNALTVANTTLSKPGDVCYYDIPISNTGDLDAYLQSISYTKPTSTTCTILDPKVNSSYRYGNLSCGNVIYYISGACAYINSVPHNESKELSLVIKYVGDSLNTATVTQKNAQITVSYTDDYSDRLFESNWFC